MSNRIEREAIYEGGSAFGHYRLAVGNGDADGAMLFVSVLNPGTGAGSINITVEPEDMIALAEQLVDAAREVRKARAEREELRPALAAGNYCNNSSWRTRAEP